MLGLRLVLNVFLLGPVLGSFVRQDNIIPREETGDNDETIEALGVLSEAFDVDFPGFTRVRRSDRGVTNLDIRDAILQLLNVIRDGNKKAEQHDFRQKKVTKDILDSVKSMTGSGGIEKKIDNISTFLLRMNNKLDTLIKGSGKGSRRATAVLETLAQESYDMITLLPTYIENTRNAVVDLGEETNNKFNKMENILLDDSNTTDNTSLRKLIRSTETNLLTASEDLKNIVVESGHMAENLFERVDSGYKDLEGEIKGLANIEQVLLDTADSVMDTKRKIEFGVQQIIFKVTELVELSGGQIDDNLANKFESITRTILSNQTEALANLTRKIEKEIGQVWRQMGIMYSKLSNSIGILEKVKDQTESYMGKTQSNLGSMDNQVEGLTDRMSDVDENLNYMLGQLSLVVQEFNQVKTGLGEAMEGLDDGILPEHGQGEDDGGR